MENGQTLHAGPSPCDWENNVDGHSVSSVSSYTKQAPKPQPTYTFTQPFVTMLL